MKKTICALVAALIGLGGCAREEYNFNGYIGEEKVEYKTVSYGSSSKDDLLKVTEKDRVTTFKLTGWGNDRLFSWCVNDICYLDKTPYQEAFKEAEKRLEDYKAKILEAKKQEALKMIKGK